MPVEIKELHIKINVDNQKKVNQGEQLVTRQVVQQMMSEYIEQNQTIQSNKKER